jgi:hypothetical protein
VRSRLHGSSSAVTPILLAGVAAALASACLPRQSGDAAEASASTPSVGGGARLRCASAPEHTIALLEAGAEGTARGTGEPSCGLALALADGQLSVHAIAQIDEGIDEGIGEGIGEGAAERPATVLASGPVPSDCGPALERCELWGVDHALGPIVLAAVRGHESEVPVQVYVGWVEDGQLGFAPSWFGLMSVADHTRVGPPWALAPYACGEGQLRLLPARRLPEAAQEGPSEAVRAAAGRWVLADDGTASLAEPAAGDRVDAAGDCQPVFVALP